MKRFVSDAIVVIGLLALLAALLAGRRALGLAGSNGGFLAFTVQGTLMETAFQHPPASSAWAFGGSAPRGLRYSTWSPGRLAVGVDNRSHRRFYGYFAVTRSTVPANAFVQAIVEPMDVTTRKGEQAETVVAVQTAWTKQTGLINYLVASNISSGGGHQYLLAGYAHGYLREARTESLWLHHRRLVLPRRKAYLVTIRTDGYHTADFWINGTQIVAARNLHLNIRPPFQVYLEVQAAHMRYAARFTWMAAFRSAVAKLQGLPADAKVTFRASGLVLRATADARGVAALSFPAPELHAQGALTISAPDGAAWHWPAFALAGGDVLQFRGLPAWLAWLRYVPAAPWLPAR